MVARNQANVRDLGKRRCGGNSLVCSPFSIRYRASNDPFDVVGRPVVHLSVELTGPVRATTVPQDHNRRCNFSELPQVPKW